MTPFAEDYLPSSVTLRCTDDFLVSQLMLEAKMVNFLYLTKVYILILPKHYSRTNLNLVITSTNENITINNYF